MKRIVMALFSGLMWNALPAHADVPLEMVSIPAGSFVMGCQDGRDSDCKPDEKPAHPVNIQAFEIGKYEVTQAQWKAVMGEYIFYKGCGDTCPIQGNTWNQVQNFINKLNAQSGKNYRLPTESEWEYACRAGKDTSYCGGNDLDAVAWYRENSGGGVHPVGQKQANAYGLYDMSGNVWEWVQDQHHDNYNGAPKDGSAWENGERYIVRRGGSWYDIPRDLRATRRIGSGVSAWKDGGYGFRLARTLP